ncbi:GNAT family N-acetyltransferase [Dethiosulfatarculus sandiegensis]|uniref:Cellulose biosynthesis protein CelD n=1 Tax=Dethiosulfatarculus sandiegensis TaxID=1429043 RepID=A0A0D2JQD3_9BACT|nr:GNAT family N-acetyltransferase [Dethiosulfatarculus sandiegensis]KIX11705.1 cellulose biosynthesis protein CelD [Dethiosulfatarculus sandiegensis]
MGSVRIVEDYEECRALWKRMMPRQLIFDLWEARACFQANFQNPLCFIVQEEKGKTKGLLPLSWVDEIKSFACFPGETWQGKTWLEQNSIPVQGDCNAFDLLCHIPGPYHLRYLRSGFSLNYSDYSIDEVGYLFRPPEYNYDMENFHSEFSGKSLKQIQRGIERLKSHGLSYRYDRPADVELMLNMNQDRFGEDSYFHDPRFAQSFLDLAHFLNKKGLLKVVTLILGGEVAAVDMGSVYKGVYTVLAGAANPDWCGVAKMINFHHLELACRMRVNEVDFLCGDFNWKKNFHLSPRPLYRLSGGSALHASPLASIHKAA